ncbi:MAG: glycosyltransferase family 4 protein [Alphaproteobacteria bacterium]
MADTAAPIAVIVKGYPRLSETFIAQEILGLQRQGLNLHIYSLRHPYDAATHPVHGEITAPVTYLPEYLGREPARVWHAWRRATKLPGYRRAWRLFRRDLARDRTRNRVRRFGQACVLATELAPQTHLLHAHFLHTPTSVARYAATMVNLPFSISAHAKDIWTSPDWELREKLADCAWLTTCTQFGATHLRRLATHPQDVILTYHGLDLERFAPRPAPPGHRDGSDPGDPLQLLSVGRLVEKKGYDDLLAALASLPSGCHWRFRHIGGGPLAKELRGQAEQLGIAERIEWLGPLAQASVLEQLRRADLFILASRIANDGDRDGLPNVLLEAQSQALTCIATTVSGIPELIADGTTGLLVPPQDPAALAAAIATLIADPARRNRLGAAGETRVRHDFSMTAGVADLAGRLQPKNAGHAATAQAAQ